MTNEHKDPEVCDACGVTAEMGYVIGAGDDVATVTINAQGADALNAQLEKYLEVARGINENIKFETTPVDADSTELTAKIQFEVTAEKIIFELNTRSLNSQ